MKLISLFLFCLLLNISVIFGLETEITMNFNYNHLQNKVEDATTYLEFNRLLLKQARLMLYSLTHLKLTNENYQNNSDQQNKVLTAVFGIVYDLQKSVHPQNLTDNQKSIREQRAFLNLYNSLEYCNCLLAYISSEEVGKTRRKAEYKGETDHVLIEELQSKMKQNFSYLSSILKRHDQIGCSQNRISFLNNLTNMKNDLTNEINEIIEKHGQEFLFKSILRLPDKVIMKSEICKQKIEFSEKYFGEIKTKISNACRFLDYGTILKGQVEQAIFVAERIDFSDCEHDSSFKDQFFSEDKPSYLKYRTLKELVNHEERIQAVLRRQETLKSWHQLLNVAGSLDIFYEDIGYPSSIKSKKELKKLRNSEMPHDEIKTFLPKFLNHNAESFQSLISTKVFELPISQNTSNRLRHMYACIQQKVH